MIYPQAEDQERAMAAIAPLLRSLHDNLHASFARYWSKEHYSGAARAEHRARTTANCIYDHAEKLMRSREGEIAGLKVLNSRGLTLFNSKDKWVVRLKKVSPSGRRANVLTGQQRDFDEQLSFEGFPDEAFRLVAGYQPDVAGTYIERVMIVRQIGGIVYWTSQVNVLEESASWVDATPARLFGLDLTHWRPKRDGRGGRG